MNLIKLWKEVGFKKAIKIYKELKEETNKEARNYICRHLDKIDLFGVRGITVESCSEFVTKLTVYYRQTYKEFFVNPVQDSIEDYDLEYYDLNDVTWL